MLEAAEFALTSREIASRFVRRKTELRRICAELAEKRMLRKQRRM